MWLYVEIVRFMNTNVDSYIQKQVSPQKEICIKLRQLINKLIPDADEEMKWGVPAFYNGKIYIVSLKDHVNIGFVTKNLPKEMLNIFDGKGKTAKSIEIHTLSDIDTKEIAKIIRLVK